MFKTRLDKLGTVLGVFWILKIFQKHFEDSTLLGTLDKKISRKIYPKTCWKHVWTLLWTILGIYGILKIFWFIKSISKTRPSMEHWLKKFSKNLPQNTFKTIFDTFGNDFGHFWSFGNFLKTFRRLDPPWNTGQKNFSKELPQNMFKTRLDKLGTVLGVFWILKIFQKHFEDSTLHGTLGKKISRKNYPKTCSKHFWTIWEQLWAFLEFGKFFEFI